MTKIDPETGRPTKLKGWEKWYAEYHRMRVLRQVLSNSQYWLGRYSPNHPDLPATRAVVDVLGPLLRELDLEITTPKKPTRAVFRKADIDNRVWFRFRDSFNRLHRNIKEYTK